MMLVTLRLSALIFFISVVTFVLHSYLPNLASFLVVCSTLVVGKDPACISLDFRYDCSQPKGGCPLLPSEMRCPPLRPGICSVGMRGSVIIRLRACMMMSTPPSTPPLDPTIQPPPLPPGAKLETPRKRALPLPVLRLGTNIFAFPRS